MSVGYESTSSGALNVVQYQQKPLKIPFPIHKIFSIVIMIMEPPLKFPSTIKINHQITNQVVMYTNKKIVVCHKYTRNVVVVLKPQETIEFHESTYSYHSIKEESINCCRIKLHLFSNN